MLTKPPSVPFPLGLFPKRLSEAGKVALTRLVVSKATNFCAFRETFNKEFDFLLIPLSPSDVFPPPFGRNQANEVICGEW